MTATPEPEGLTAVLLQLAGLTQKLAQVEERHSGEAREIRARMTAMTRAVEQVKETVAGQARALAALDGLDGQVTDLAGRLAELNPDDADTGPAAYQPSPLPRFWKLAGPARDQAISKLRAWVEQVYRPGYGHVSASLGDCWDQHPLCLYIMDWLSELWSVLYLAKDRTPGTLAGQAEWHARLLAAAAEQLARETRGCGHADTRWRGAGRDGARP